MAKRLSEVKGDAAFELMEAVSLLMCAVAESPEVQKVIGTDSTTYEQTAALFPVMLSQQRDQLVRVLAALDGKTPEEYREGVDYAKLMSDFTSLVSDDGFAGFLAPRQSPSLAS